MLAQRASTLAATCAVALLVACAPSAHAGTPAATTAASQCSFSGSSNGVEWGGTIVARRNISCASARRALRTCKPSGMRGWTVKSLGSGEAQFRKGDKRFRMRLAGAQPPCLPEG
ncbi:MAG: hypothetical protein JHC84_05730 [Solirubrobacteraceae bacterium]|nr:hypothetical protein [Solirubrobacteraceae bacterium]